MDELTHHENMDGSHDLGRQSWCGNPECESDVDAIARKKAQRMAMILGAADGLTIATALLFGRNPAVFRSALNAGLGEFVGMGGALFLADKKHVFAAFLCGLATLLACVAPVIPFLFLPFAVAFGTSVALDLVVGAVICWLRPEKGWLAIAETFGVIVLCAGLCFAVSFLFR